MEDEILKLIKNLPAICEDEIVSVSVGKSKDILYSSLNKVLFNGPITKWRNYRYSSFSRQIAQSLQTENNKEFRDRFFKKLESDDRFGEYLYDRARDVELSRSKKLGPKLIAVLTTIVGMEENSNYSDSIEANIYEMFREMNDNQLERSYIFFCELRRCYNEIIDKHNEAPSSYLDGKFYMWFESPENRLEGSFNSYDRSCMKVPEKVEWFTINLSSDEIHASGENWGDQYQEIDIMNISGKWAKILEDTGIIFKRVSIKTQSTSEDPLDYTEPGSINISIEGEVKVFMKILNIMDGIIDHDGQHKP